MASDNVIYYLIKCFHSKNYIVENVFFFGVNLYISVLKAIINKLPLFHWYISMLIKETQQFLMKQILYPEVELIVYSRLLLFRYFVLIH